MTLLLEKDQFAEVVSLLKKGEIVAFPTDTVFGIGVIYSDRNAVEKMKIAKGRDAHKPFPLMVADVSQMEQVAYLSEREKMISLVYMPGALTMVLNRRDSIDPAFVNGFKTVAIRIPQDDFVLRLLRAVGPMFVTSANNSGEPAANTHEEVLSQLDGRIAAVVKGEALSHTASTIIDCTSSQLRCLREGDISFTDLERTTTQMQDREIAEAIQAEELRERHTIELIASENYASRDVMAATGSILTNKYAEGYPGKRYYGGCDNVDRIEEIARERMCRLFHAEHANVQPHSGSQANMAVYFTVLKPGDRVLGMELAAGGHLTHGHKLSFSGRLYQFESYGVSRETEMIDYDELREKVREFRPRLVVAGASAYSRFIDYKRIREICDEFGALMMVDMAHVAGLVAAGLHPNPCEYADFVTTTTHKTLRGPRGGAILCRQKYARDLDRNVFPGIQGGPLEHVIAAKAVCFWEALQPSFIDYQKQVLANCQVLCRVLKEEGFQLVSGGSDNHLVLVDVKGSVGMTGKQAETLLDSVGITCNKNSIPFDEERPAYCSGIRLGTAAMTTRGCNEDDFDKIAHWISRVLRNPEDQEELNKVREEVRELTDRLPLY